MSNRGYYEEAFMLTRRDEEILRVIHFYRYMTAQDVACRLFSVKSKIHVREILSALAGGADRLPDQYLYRFGLPKATTGNVERIYTLGSRGRDFLVNHGGLPVNWHFRPSRMANLNYSYLMHALILTKFLVAAHVWAKLSDFQLLETKISYELGKIGSEVIPDGWLLFEREGRKHPVLLEIDRGTEYQKAFKQHIASRFEFVRSGDYERMFGEKAVLVVYVAVGDLPYRETRRKTMMAWTREILKEMERENWGSLFRFLFTPFPQRTLSGTRREH